MDKTYRSLLGQYTSKNGACAILLYAINLFLLFLQGYLFTTNIPTVYLIASQVVFPLLSLILCILLVCAEKEKLDTIGVHKQNLWKSLWIGVLCACILLAFQIITQKRTVSMNGTTVVSLMIFTTGAISEEFFFRGYLSTRFTGLLKSPAVASCVTGILFFASHYPMKWIVTGTISLGILSGSYILYLLLLHFLCDFVYKKTNCLWGSIALHFMYNIISSMIVYK